MAAVRKALLGPGFFAALLNIGSAQGALFHVEVNTFGAPVTEAVMAFDLSNDPTTSHQVAITNFYTNGTLLVCPIPDACTFPVFVTSSPQYDPSGADITGELPLTVTIYDTPIGGFDISPITYFQNLLLDVTSAGVIRFDFEMTGDTTTGNQPEGFSLSLFDAATGGYILAEDVLFAYNFGAEQPCVSFSQATTCTEIPASNGVPEPGVLALAIAGLLGIGVARSKRVGSAPAPARQG